SGEVLGHAGRISKFEFAGQTFRNVPTSFPDSSAGTFGENGRQGNLGSGILRRFKIIYDYSRKQMILEPNKFVGDPFGTPLPTVSTVAIAPAMLNDYVGKYGNKEISVREGTLHYQRIGGSGATLRAIGKDKFVLNADAQLTFVRDARNAVTELIIAWVERDREHLKREPLDSSPKPSPTNSPAANESTFITELGSFLEKTVADDKFSGAVLVARDDQTLFKKAYGLANKEN